MNEEAWSEQSLIESSKVASLLKCISKGLNKINDQNQDEDVKIARWRPSRSQKARCCLRIEESVYLEYSIPLQLHKKARMVSFHESSMKSIIKKDKQMEFPCLNPSPHKNHSLVQL